MLDPISLAAATAVLGAVGAGMANEAGKRAWESAGGLVRRIAGREVSAPTTSREAEAVARLVSEGLRREPGLSPAWDALARQMPRFAVASARPQLPPAPRFFTDRKAAMKLLGEEASRAADGRPRIALLHGPEGMGTSTLALHWGSREANRFPHGQLYVDLRGQSADSALDATAALSRLLGQLGLAAEDIPPTAEERSEYFRRIASDRRLLVVLDHAYSAAQIRPLITSATGLFTLVVARHPLPGLDALRIPVGPLADKDARRLLTEIAGRPAITAARATLEPVIARCGGSPYALRAAAPRLSALSSHHHPRQEVFAVPENEALQTAAEDTYRLLDPDAARLYRLLGLRPWPFIGPAAAAWAAQISEDDAARILATLAELQLLEGTDDGRYRYRPAVRRHAEQTAARVDGIAACASAVARMTEGYRHTALHAAHHALPESWRVPPLPEGSAHSAHIERGQALGILAAEAGNIVQAMHTAAEFGDHHTVMDLGRALWPLQLKAGHHDELLPVLRLAADSAATSCPGTRTAGALNVQLAHTLTELRRFDEAEAAALAATAAEREAGHARGHASATELLGLLRLRQWRFDEAYDCFEEAGQIYDTIAPDGEGAPDLPRARALLERHRGRALRGMGRRPEAQQRLESALQFFRDSQEAYNTARVLTDLAETLLDQQDRAAALPHIDEAINKLGQEQASYPLVYLRALREQCLTPRS
ncbi:tetratricopeptide repeat protein [Streptomyces sp. ISL-96]|uniref:tetratricopeptide repeat protein n=1 Tax=Streptomyces sp. ISL-96 TaxID=2819191 RepID=UPI001BEB81EA|nr:tetratricopeptide repeat protein [Streptomyces sp. ISL-96]MBT2492850.1 tetratricopeptide repeat protein [Streptomyces sp. ISL-96]